MLYVILNEGFKKFIFEDQTHTDGVRNVMSVLPVSTKLKAAVRTPSEGGEGKSLATNDNPLGARLRAQSFAHGVSYSP